MRRIIAVAFCVVGFVTACGNDGGGAPTVATPPPGAEDSSGIRAAECQDLTSGAQAPIEISDFRFDPPCAEMKASQGFELQNNGENLHNFSVEGVAGIDVDIAAGQTNNTETPGLDPDTYTFFCKYHRDQGMEGELRLGSG